jgi:anaerobic magnesium-protoporphyrin IX monomethyl ester cyclase
MPSEKSIRVALITPIEDEIPVQVSAYKAWMPRYGSVAVAQALKDAGYDTRHYCEHSGSIIDWDYVMSCDYVCFSLMTFCAYRGYKQADRVRENSDAKLIFGGCHATVAPEDCLDHCDFAVRNEGEETLLELIDALENGRDTSRIQGMSYRDSSGAFHHNPDRPFMSDISSPVDISVIEGYPPNRLGRFLLEALTRRQLPRISLPVAQASRGCVHKCRFCMVKYELGSQYRERPAEVVLEEIERAFEHLGSRTIFFVDNDFTHNTDHALSILEPLVEKYDGKFSIYFFSRVELAKKQRLLDVMSRIENVYLGLGFESTNDSTLSEFSKGQTSDFERDVSILNGYGFNIHGLFIFGADADTEASLMETVNFSLGSKLYTVGFSALYDIPGKEKTVGIPQILPDHRFIHRDWRLFTGHFVVFFPRQIRPSRLQRIIIDGQKHFFRKNRDTFYQYFPVYASSEPYCSYLEEQEKGLYDSQDRLIEERLQGRTFENLERIVPIIPSRLVKFREVSEFLVQNAFRAKSWKMLARNFGSGSRPGKSTTVPDGIQV